MTEGSTERLIPTDPRQFILRFEDISRHMAVVGEPGSGKTVALMRVMRSWTEAAWLRFKETAERPLLVFVDGKGGRDGKATSEQFVAMSTALGLDRDRIGVWPEQDRLDLWGLEPMRLFEVLVELIKSTHPFWDSMRGALVEKAVFAPCGPPQSSVEFVSRLNAKWLLRAWQGDEAACEMIRKNSVHYASIAEQYRVLFLRIGSRLDAGRDLDDFDALVMTLEGTQNPTTAAAQAQGILELVRDLAARDVDRRRVLLVIDEYSAISDRVSVAEMMERVRSLGVSVIAAAQSYVGLGANNDERDRILSAAAGGMLVMATSDPEKLAKRAGTGVVVEVGIKRLQSGGFGDEGSARAQRGMVAPADWIRALAEHPGQAVFIRANRATWGVVAAPAMVSPRAMKMALYQRRSIDGPRIPLAELEAGLQKLSASDVLAGEKVQF